MPKIQLHEYTHARQHTQRLRAHTAVARTRWSDHEISQRKQATMAGLFSWQTYIPQIKNVFLGCRLVECEHLWSASQLFCSLVPVFLQAMFALGAWALMWKHPVCSKYLHQNSDTVTMQAGIHTDFHRFTEISQIFQNVSGTPRNWTLIVQNIWFSLRNIPRTPLEAFALGTCFETKYRSPFLTMPGWKDTGTKSGTKWSLGTWVAKCLNATLLFANAQDPVHGYWV